jgi:hypothetical protein
MDEDDDGLYSSRQQSTDLAAMLLGRGGRGGELKIRACLVSSHNLPNQSVANHKSVAVIKSVAKKFEAKLWQELAKIITL